MLDRFRLDGRVAVVTGAGRGIGAATAVALAEAGADVVIAARSPDQLEATATAIEAAGRAAHVVLADLSDTAQAARPFLDTTTEALEEAFRFNVSTAHALITSAIPLMLDNGGGSVINISSVLALISGRGFLSYGTAKGALARYTELAAQDLAPRIRVNAIAAGTIATAATEVITADAGLRARVEAATPLRRLGTVDDVAAAVLYLASPASAYLTGTVLEVHGGLQAPNTQQPLPDL